MSDLQLKLPDNLHKIAKRYAKKDHISLNQFIVTSLSNEVIRYETLSFFEPIALKHNEKKFLEILNKVPGKIPDEEDRF